MSYLNTEYPTIILNESPINANIIDSLSDSQGQIRHTTYYDHTEGYSSNIQRSVIDSCSDLLTKYGFTHNKAKWSMDVIRYNLKNEMKGVSSGLAWHCENDNGNNLITVLLYLRLDDTIIDGNLRYKDVNNTKQIIPICSGTTIIMDGNVPHKPQNPYGTGKRDLIIVSFKKLS
jgi:hypothetical protein